MENTLDLGLKTELVILQNALRDREHFNLLKTYLRTYGKKSYFEDLLDQKILNWFCDYESWFDNLPSKNDTTYAFLINQEYKSEVLEDRVYNRISQVYEEKETLQPEFIKYETIKFIKKQKAHEKLLETSDEIEKIKFSGLIEGFQEIEKIGTENEDIGISIIEVDKIDDLYEEGKDENGILTQYDVLDEYLNGGFKNGELSCLAGIPASGKSLFLSNFAANIYNQNYNVVYYSFEMSERICYQRIHSNLLNIPVKDLLLMESEKRKEKLKKLGPGLFVKRYPTKQISASDIEIHIEKLRDRKFFPDIIFVDYILLMALNSKKEMDNSYADLKKVSEELRDSAEKLNIPIVSAGQLNRTAIAKEGGSIPYPTIYHLAESKGIADTADFMAVISNHHKKPDPNDPEKDPKKKRQIVDSNSLDLVIRKNRNGEQDKIINFRVDYRTMKIGSLELGI